MVTRLLLDFNIVQQMWPNSLTNDSFVSRIVRQDVDAFDATFTRTASWRKLIASLMSAFACNSSCPRSGEA